MALAGMHFSRVLKGRTYATAARPSAALAGVGTQIYDATLKKPLWSDGTVWRDATGTAA